MDQDFQAGTSAETRPITGHHFARNLDWNLLRTFHDIVRAGGISNAARQTSRKQPAISMALQRLEDLVGARLCRRGASGFFLTREGELLAEVCETIFGAVTQIPSGIVEATGDIRGRIRIQMISNLVHSRIDNAIGKFHRAHPAVEVFVGVATWDVIPRSLLRNEVEIGLAPARFRDPDLRYDHLFTEVYRPYCGRNHPLYGETIRDPGELARHGLIHTGADEPDQLTKYRLRYGIGSRVAGLSEHMEEARRLALVGVGICFLPDAFVAEEVSRGLLHPLLSADSVPSSEIFIISSPHTPMHQVRDLMLSYLRGAA